MSYLQAILKTEFSFFATTAGKVFTFLLILAAVYGFFPTQSAMPIEEKMIFIFLAGLFGNFLMTAMTWWYTSKQHKITFEWDADFIKKTLLDMLPYGLALFLGAIFFKVDILLLSTLEPTNMADKVTGLYGLPLKIIDVSMFYGTVFLNSLLPVLTPAVKENNHKKVLALTSKGFEILTSFGIGIALFLFFFAPEILSLISSHENANMLIYGNTAVDVLRVVAWIFVFYFVGSLANFILIARDKQSILLIVNSILAAINIIGNCILIPHFHFMGAAAITIVTQVLFFVIMWYLVRDSFENKKNLIWMISFFLWNFGGIFLIFSGLQKFLSFQSNFLTLAVAGGLFAIWFFGGWFLMRKVFKKIIS